MISNEHPEVLERLKPNPALRPKVEAGAALLREAREMRVLSEAGTDLIVDMREAARVAATGAWRMRQARYRIGRAGCASAIPAAAASTVPW
jgi:2,5-dihydroxypyridine 5,6-dioxygenase